MIDSSVMLERKLGSQANRRHDQPSMAHTATDLQRVLDYHQRTKHHLERYASGPETLDWSSQPEPFRSFAGAPQIPLTLAADWLTTPYFAIHGANLPPRTLSLEAVGLLLELSLGLSAWKEYGPDRWALRCNPSSGNLHPTEGYIISQAVPDLADGVYHYLSRDHVLEQRCRLGGDNRPGLPSRLFVGLSSIHWREAWKYGERAFRYCQLDTGHALGALRYAAAALGWRLRLVEGINGPDLAGWLGLDRDPDFSGVEEEEAELLLEVIANPGAGSLQSLPDFTQSAQSWHGTANLLDPHPMYHWPIIDEVAAATGKAQGEGIPFAPETWPPLLRQGSDPAASIIRQRRSAQRFDARSEMSLNDFLGLMDALLPRAIPPWDAWNFTPRLHPVLFVHRVAGLAPGLYILPRRAQVKDSLRSAMQHSFTWSKPANCPDHLPLFELAAGGCTQLARTLHCHQAIASDSAFALGMLAEFDAPLSESPWHYRQLYWEAGLIGQALYLEAEALGLRGTGIGCYFDDAFHQLLGLTDKTFQSLYHFTVGTPLTDARILSLPPYPDRH